MKYKSFILLNLTFCGALLSSAMLLSNNADATNIEFDNYIDVSNPNAKAIINGKWGTSSISFDNMSKTLTIGPGTISGFSSHPKYISPTLNILRSEVKNIKFDGKVTIENNANFLFAGFTNVSNMTGYSNLMMNSSVTSMDYMFYEFAKDANLSQPLLFAYPKWDVSNVKSMDYMFYGAKFRDYVFQDGSGGWNTKSLESTASMFANTTAENYGVEYLNMQNVKNADSMFYNSNLKQISMFDAGLSTKPADNWNLKSLKNGNQMFAKSSLKTFPSFIGTASSLENMNKMFLDVTGIESYNFKNSKLKPNSMAGTFSGVKAKLVDITDIDQSGLASVSSMFSYATIDTINFVNPDVNKQRAYFDSMSNMFLNAKINSFSNYELFAKSYTRDASYMYKGISGDIVNEPLRFKLSPFSDANAITGVFSSIPTMTKVILDVSSLPCSNNVCSLKAPLMFSNDYNLNEIVFEMNSETSSSRTIRFYNNIASLPNPPADGLFSGGWMVSPSGYDQFVGAGNEQYIDIEDVFLGRPKSLVWKKGLSSNANMDVTVNISQSKKPASMLSEYVIDPSHPGSNYIRPTSTDGNKGNGFESFFINWASNFDFGMHTINYESLKDPKLFTVPSKSTYLTSEINNLAPFIQVTDLSGDEMPWSVSLKASQFTSTSGDILKGSYIDLPNVSVIASDMQEVPSSKYPKTFMSNRLNPEKPYRIDFTNDSYILFASYPRQGFGTWTFSFTTNEDGSYSEKGSPHLNIPLNLDTLPQSGDYSSQLTWVFSTDPTSSITVQNLEEGL